MRRTTYEKLPSYTPEQYKIARYQSSALEYAISQNYNIVRMGNIYSIKEHDSMVFTLDGWWYWNSHDIKGGAIEFITKYEEKSLVEAVLILSGGDINTVSFSSQSKAKPIFQPKEINEEKKEFILPEKASDYKRLYGYLINERKLDPQIVSKLVKERAIYLSSKHNNVVFIGFDEAGIAKSAFQRGTFSFTKQAFKGDVIGSDKTYPFCIKGKPSATIVSVFEASIDAISHASIYKNKKMDYEDRHRISIGGLSNMGALDRFLKQNPQVTHIEICFDNDIDGLDHNKKPCNHGQVAANKWQEEYINKGYVVRIRTPQENDFNQVLKNMAQDEKNNNHVPKKPISEPINEDIDEAEMER